MGIYEKGIKKAKSSHTFLNVGDFAQFYLQQAAATIGLREHISQRMPARFQPLHASRDQS